MASRVPAALSIAQVANLAGCSRRHVYDEIAAGRLHSVSMRRDDDKRAFARRLIPISAFLSWAGLTERDLHIAFRDTGADALREAALHFGTHERQAWSRTQVADELLARAK